MSGSQTDQTDVLGRRIGAALIDLALLFVAMLVIGAAFGETETGEASISVSLEGVSALVFFAFALLYYFAGELAFGRTLGKLALGLRVTGLDGRAIGAGQSAIRTALRVIDFLPFFYLVGLISALVTRERQARLGDLAAKTRVVRRVG